MTRSSRRFELFSPTRGVILALAGWFAAGSFPVSAGPINDLEASLRASRKQLVATRLMEARAAAHVRKVELELRAQRDVNRLTWVRDHHPAAFDHRHPIVGALLSAAQGVKGTSFSAKTEAIHATALESKTATPQAQMLETPLQVVTAPPHVALQEFIPPVPSTGRFYPPISEEHSSASVVSSTYLPAQGQSLEGSPEPIPEPTSIALMLLLFGSAARWGRRRARG
jgi:hypothetical protein